MTTSTNQDNAWHMEGGEKNCHGLHHFTGVCKHPQSRHSTDKEDENQAQAQIHCLEEQWTGNIAADDGTIVLKANGTVIDFTFDICAQANVLPETVLLTLKEKPQVVKDKWIKLRAYSGELIPTKGICKLDGWINNKLEKIQSVIVPVSGKRTSSIRLKAWQALGLIKRVHSSEGQGTKTIEEEFEDIFKGIKKLSTEYRTELKEANRTTITPVRRSPHLM